MRIVVATMAIIIAAGPAMAASPEVTGPPAVPIANIGDPCRTDSAFADLAALGYDLGKLKRDPNGRLPSRAGTM